MEEEGKIMPEDLFIESTAFTLPAWSLEYQEEPAVTDTIASSGNVKIVAVGASTYTVRSYDTMDIQGWTTKQKKTFYPASIALQRGFTYQFTGPATAGDQVWDVVFIMPRELTDTEQLELVSLNYPSFQGTGVGDTSSIDKQHVLWGQWNFVSSDSVITPVAVVRDRGNFGTGLPTVANRLWVYRFSHIGIINATHMNMPPLQGIVEGAFGKEPEMEYMERLRRTFVLASDLE